MKVALPLDKRAWHPSPLPGQIVLVSSIDGEGRPNVAPKSWVTMTSLELPALAFGCNVTHATYQNVVATNAFVVNVLPESLVETAWTLSDRHGEERLQTSGLTLATAHAVAAPLVDECPAHLECELDDVKRYGDEVLIFGRVVAASIDEVCLRGDPEERYARLAPAFFLEGGTFAALGPVRRVTP